MIEDIPLEHAELCWNDRAEGGAAAVISVAQPLSRRDQERVALYDNAVGACFADWASKSDDRRLAELMRDAFFAVTKDGADHRSVLAALLHIPEFRALLHPGELAHHLDKLGLEIEEEA